MAREINHGIAETVDCDIKLYDMVIEEADKVVEELALADGILFGTPTVNGDALPPVSNLVAGLSGITHGGKIAASYGSYGWSGEAIKIIDSQLKLLKLNVYRDGLSEKFYPSPEKEEKFYQLGIEFGEKLTAECI